MPEPIPVLADITKSAAFILTPCPAKLLITALAEVKETLLPAAFKSSTDIFPEVVFKMILPLSLTIEPAAISPAVITISPDEVVIAPVLAK